MNNTAEISIVLATRTGATGHQGPLTFLNAMQSSLLNPHNIEIIIRGDNDDAGFDSLMQAIKDQNYLFRVDFVKGERGRGYEDLHNFYHDCLLLTSPHKKIIFSLPEDVTITQNHWDKLLLDQYSQAVEKMGHRVFTMHQTLQPGLNDDFEESMENPDSFPIYSSDWMHALGGFCHSSANDSWVQATHHYLIKEFGLHMRHFLPGVLFQRETDPLDSIMNPRWSNARLRNHDFMRCQRTRKIFQRQADILRLLACEQMTEANSEGHNVADISNTVNYAADQYGTMPVLYKTMYHFINSASVEQIDQFMLASYLLANQLLVLKEGRNFDAEKMNELAPLYSLGRLNLAISSWSRTEKTESQNIIFKNTQRILKKIGIIKLFYYYCTFRISKHLKKDTDTFNVDREILNLFFWSVKPRELIRLVYKIIFRKSEQ